MGMPPIIFFDTEISTVTKKIVDIGAITESDDSFHSASVADFIVFIKGAEFLCGHNALKHDLLYVKSAFVDAGINPRNIIDTLYLSPLLFPAKPYHALVKDDKLSADDNNNPLNDSKNARLLFHDELAAFSKLDSPLKDIFYYLLHIQPEFSAFFSYLHYIPSAHNPEELIYERFRYALCEHSDIPRLIHQYPVELAYCLALINTNSRYSLTPPWVLKNYPYVGRVMHLLRNSPCLTGCTYCNSVLDVHATLHKYFGFTSYRTFAGEALQEKAVAAAVNNESILVVFPTGGGKSLTFQVPALLAGETTKGLTVVISPLQSLMKDQVDNLEKSSITEAVTINGLLDPVERAKSIERVADGTASILYISPESLRSKTIEQIILGRRIVRFVIDEAHCFSAWGQDFRVDYLYIGDFIRKIQEKKNMDDIIPVSCFTATAKQKVIEDITAYFKEKLSLNLRHFTSTATRSNLHFKVYEKGNEEEKYNALRGLIEDHTCPTIVYVSRTRRAYELALRLTQDGFEARPYHGKMEAKEKSENQDAFISGAINIIVATSAFGMGVDKKDVGMVIHFEISDSLENYVQEAGRAGRDEHITADCYVLYNEEDLNKHFILLNQTKLNINEIKQIWNAIKYITKFRTQVSQSALEIARKAGWDENISQIETRVTTAIAALEEAGYVERGQNMPRIFANSILSKTSAEAIEKIMTSPHFVNERQRENAIRIIKKLFSSKSRSQATDQEAESRVDYIADVLGIVKEEVIAVINILREEKILADSKDLTAFIRSNESANRSLAIFETYRTIELFLLNQIEEQEKTFSLKELKQRYEAEANSEIAINHLRTILNFWAIKQWIKRQTSDFTHNHLNIIGLQPREQLHDKLVNRHILSRFITEYLYRKSTATNQQTENAKEEVLVEFSVNELKTAYENENQLFGTAISFNEIEDSIFFLSRINAIKIEGGFLVIYNRLTINRLEQNNRVQYKAEDYQKLDQFYKNKAQQIHIVGEYAKKMIDDYKEALVFVDDYFQLNYTSFLNKYFPGSRQDEIKRNLTPAKYRQLFGALSPMQRTIIDDKSSKYIVVAAGPGSGKTRVLVHKLASLLLMEDVKHEQLLMLTFSRAAATEFKQRLMQLIGNAAAFIEIKTFHSYCFDLLGKTGSLESSDTIIRTAIDKINAGEIEQNRFTKTVLVIDEAQDMDATEFALVELLADKNEEMRIIAVGDDDQNIYAFRGADSRYLSQLITDKKAKKYELSDNYRSKNNLVAFTNAFVTSIRNRLKHSPVSAFNADNGKLSLVHYTTQYITDPVVNAVFNARLTGSVCVLTKTNEEALHISGRLIQRGIHAKLIQSSDEFKLYHLAEVRFLLDALNRQSDSLLLSDDDLGHALKSLIKRYSKSPVLEVVVNLLKQFENTYPRRKYKSDLDKFIHESKPEDFINITSETVVVSTMHKAKGKEFDNVFIMLNNFNLQPDDQKRLLYVAMTRARNTLSIHYNGQLAVNLNRIEHEQYYDTTDWKAPDEFAMQLSHRDINLGYFEYVHHRINRLTSGDKLIVAADGLCNTAQEPVLKFSKRFLEMLNQTRKSGFILQGAEVNFIVYWYNEQSGKEVKILLPVVSFVLNNEAQ